MYRYTVLLFTTCTDELYLCVHNLYKRNTHTLTHTDTAFYIYLDSCTYIHTRGAHTMLGSVELLYVYTVNLS